MSAMPTFTIEDLIDPVWTGKVELSDKWWTDVELEDNFLVFYVSVFAWLGLPRPSRAQMELAQFISDPSNPHRMLMCLRGLSKSLTAQIYVAWRLLNDPNEKILVMSATGTRATNFTAFVQKLIKLVPILNPMAPRMNEERTSGSAFDVAGATPSDSPSVYAVGVENAIAGFRATLVVYDDIESAQSARSAVLREKIDHYASEASNLLIAGRDESITLCTPHSMDSIYMDWIMKGHKPMVIPSEYPSDSTVYNGNLAPYIEARIRENPSLIGTPVDERFNRDVLDNKSLKIGKSQYKLQYLLDVTESDSLRHPLKLSDLIVTDVDLDDAPLKITHSSMPANMLYTKHNGFKADHLFAPSFVSPEMAEYEERVMVIDPSGRGDDETGYAVGFTLNGRLFVKETGGVIGGYDKESMDTMLSVAKVNKINIIVVESNFGDGAYRKMLDSAIANAGLNIITDEITSHSNKEARMINTIEPLLNQHRIVMDKTNLERDKEFSRSLRYSLTYQLSHLTFDKGSIKHDDRLDALALLCEYLLESFDVVEGEAFRRKEEEELAQIYNQLEQRFEFGGTSNNYGTNY